MIWSALQASVSVMSLILLNIMLVYAAVSDWKYRIIPNWLTLGSVALFALYVLSGNLPSAWYDHVLVSLVIFVILLPLFALGKMGGGDVKLIAALALWSGSAHILEFIILMALLGGLLALIFIHPLFFSLIREVNKLVIIPTSGVSQTCRGLPYGVAIALSGLICVNSHYWGG